MRRVPLPVECCPAFGCPVTLFFAESWTDWLRLLMLPGEWHRDGYGRLCKIQKGEAKSRVSVRKDKTNG